MLYLRGRHEKKPKRITAFLFLTDTFRKAFDKDTVSVKEMYVFHRKAKSKNSKAGWFFAAPLVDQFSKLGKAVSKFFREIEQHLSIKEMTPGFLCGWKCIIFIFKEHGHVQDLMKTSSIGIASSRPSL